MGALEAPMCTKAVGLASFAALFAIPAVAHHSFAMFDAEKISTLEGTLKEFEWTNPHASKPCGDPLTRP
jgi:hypothetical protein